MTLDSPMPFRFRSMQLKALRPSTMLEALSAIPTTLRREWSQHSPQRGSRAESHMMMGATMLVYWLNQCISPVFLIAAKLLH